MTILYRLIIIFIFSLVYSDCMDYINEADCSAAQGCEWHADDMACEDGDEDHDHEEH